MTLSYTYRLHEILTTTTDHICESSYDDIYLCAYYVNVSSSIPFLQYLLKDDGCNRLTFPKMSFVQDIVPYAIAYLSRITHAPLVFQGLYECNRKLYIFVNIQHCVSTSSDIHLGLIDEILNCKCICNRTIDEQVTNLFVKHELLCYLVDDTYTPYETPVVGFVSKNTQSELRFHLTFGENAKDKSAIFGPYFYFTNYQNAVSQTNRKGGVVRYALYMGNTKYIENKPNDRLDESDIKKQRLKDDEMNNKREILTMRISDHNGLWSTTYDSIYVGGLELDDGSLLENVPIIVLKKYEQHIPLTCHHPL